MSSSPQNKRYFIRQYARQEYPHGGIGYVDAEKLIMAEGFEPIELPHHEDFTFRAKAGRLFHLFRLVISIKKGSVVVFIFPVYARLNRLLLWFLLKKAVTPVCFVADINGIKDADEKELASEVHFLRSFRYFIVHNDGMKQWMVPRIPPSHFETIDFFDFLTPALTKNRALSFDIVFAGNLEKSPFLEKLHLLVPDSPSLHFHLYGPGQTANMLRQKNVSWYGVEKPYALPAKLRGAFGLLWDDACIDKPCGGYGDYMQYISHHKLSLYILSRLPVIVPSIAGSAPLIEKYKIGFSVNNLYEIEEKIKAISADDHRQMQDNMKQLSEKISTGGCMREALGKMMEAINKK
jgi:hypothetical protein